MTAGHRWVPIKDESKFLLKSKTGIIATGISDSIATQQINTNKTILENHSSSDELNLKTQVTIITFQ